MIVETVSTIFNFIRLGRPYYVLPPIAAAIAGYVSSDNGDVSWMIITQICAVFLLLGMSSWTANEITDQASDMKGSKKELWGLYVSGGTQLISGESLSQRAVTTYIVILATIGLAISTTFGMVFFGLALLFLIIGLAYSIRPVRLKERGIVGLAVIVMAYGIVSFSAGWVTSDRILTTDCLVYAGFLSLIFLGFEGIAHLTDREQDHANGENTFAVALGERTAKYILAACQCIPILGLIIIHEWIPFLQDKDDSLIFLALLSTVFAAFTILSRNNSQLCT